MTRRHRIAVRLRSSRGVDFQAGRPRALQRAWSARVYAAHRVGLFLLGFGFVNLPAMSAVPDASGARLASVTSVTKRTSKKHSNKPIIPVAARRMRLEYVDKKTRHFVEPYPLKRILRGFGKCRPDGTHRHPAIDIAGIGKDAGLGTPVFSIVPARVTLIGLPEEDAKQFGTPLLGAGHVARGYKGRLKLPKSKRIPGYGRVHFFTKDYGSWRSGVVIVTRGLEGPLKDHVIRYMHLGAVHPSLKRGSTLRAGEELGLMGGTAIMESAPHVHIDIEDPDGKRVDIAKLFGLPQVAPPCPKPTH